MCLCGGLCIFTPCLWKTERAWDPLEVESQTVVRFLTWEFWGPNWSSVRAAYGPLPPRPPPLLPPLLLLNHHFICVFKSLFYYFMCLLTTGRDHHRKAQATQTHSISGRVVPAPAAVSTARLLYLRLRDRSGRGDGKSGELHQQSYTHEVFPTRLPKQDLEKDDADGPCNHRRGSPVGPHPPSRATDNDGRWEEEKQTSPGKSS